MITQVRNSLRGIWIAEGTEEDEEWVTCRKLWVIWAVGNKKKRRRERIQRTDQKVAAITKSINKKLKNKNIFPVTHFI